MYHLCCVIAVYDLRLNIYYVAAQDKNMASGRGQKQGGRGGDRERGERQDNRRPHAGENKEREDRPPRGQNAGGRRQRLPSKEKDRVRMHKCVCVCVCMLLCE